MNDILVPIITPFKEDMSVDYDTLKEIVGSLLSEGAGGIYAGGSSAEFVLLTHEERKKTLEAIVEAAGGARVVAHIGSTGLDMAIDLAKHASDVGAHAISSVAPFYFHYSFDEVKAYYSQLASSTDLKLMIYNMPANTNKKFTLDEFLQLIDDENIESIKYTDTNFYLLERVKTLTGIKMYSGEDACFISALASGADGAIGTTFNFMVQNYIEIKKLFVEGKVDEALKIQQQCNSVTRVVMDTKTIPATKYLMRKKGLNINYHSRMPIRPLSKAEMTQLDEVFNKQYFR